MSAPAHQPTRDELLAEYDRLSRLMVKTGLEPVVSDAVLSVFSDSELRSLVRDCTFRLIRVRSLQ